MSTDPELIPPDPEPEDDQPGTVRNLIEKIARFGAMGFLILTTILILLACAGLFTLFIGYPLGRELIVKQTLNVYDDAFRIADDWAHTYPGTINKKIFYWTEDPLETVRAYYEPYTSDFIYSHDRAGEWWIARMDPDVSVSIPPYEFVGHGWFCSRPDEDQGFGRIHEYYDCVTVALVDMEQPASRAIISPGQFGGEVDETPSRLGVLPRYGTLIIFGYYIWDFS